MSGPPAAGGSAVAMSGPPGAGGSAGAISGPPQLGECGGHFWAPAAEDPKDPNGCPRTVRPRTTGLPARLNALRLLQGLLEQVERPAPRVLRGGLVVDV